MSPNIIPWRKEIARLRHEMDGLYARFFDVKKPECPARKSGRPP
jgi:hypothetical protein